MEISAVMNIQELAVNKAVRLHADAQERQEKINQQKELQAASEGVLTNKTPVEKDIAALSNSAQQQLDPQLTSSKVERQVDAQAARETVPGAEGKNKQGTGYRVDIVT